MAAAAAAAEIAIMDKLMANMYHVPIMLKAFITVFWFMMLTFGCIRFSMRFDLIGKEGRQSD